MDSFSLLAPQRYRKASIVPQNTSAIAEAVAHVKDLEANLDTHANGFLSQCKALHSLIGMMTVDQAKSRT